MATMTGFISGQAVMGALNSLKTVLLDVLSDGIDGAIEGQEAFRAFAQALATTGTYSKEAAKEFKEFADRLQFQTGITAEATLETGKLLTSLTSLRGQGLQDATLAIANMASVMGVDMGTASKAFSKAIGGHAEGLAKLGIAFDASGTKAENAANLVEALNTKFGGAASSQAKTYAGAINILKLSWGELTEEFGKGIVENKAVLDLFQNISRMFMDMTNDVGLGSVESKKAIAGMIELMLDFGSAVLEVASFVKPVISGIAVTFQSVADAISQYVILARDGFSAAAKFGEESSKKLSESWDNIGNTKAIDEMVGRFELLKAGVRESSKEITASSDTTKTNLDGITNSVTRHVSELTKAQELLKEWAKTQADQAATTQGIYDLELASLQANFDAKLITEEEYLASKEALVMQNIANENAMLDAAASQNLIRGQDLINARYAMEMKASQAQLQLAASRVQQEDKLNKEREANFKSNLNTIATLASSNSKALAAIGKAAAITQATIDGYAAVQKAWAQGGFLGAGMAVAVGVATAANVAKIAGVPLATGIDEVPGSGFKDNFPAVLAPGERVVPRETNQDLTRFLEMQGQQKGAQINVNVTMNDVFTSDPREMGMKIIETINEAAQANGIQILGSTIR
jgi:hypothetical protein